VFPKWLEGGQRVLLDENGELLDCETFVQIRISLVARILTNALGKIAMASELPKVPEGIVPPCG
jgi:hypothetical protein